MIFDYFVALILTCFPGTWIAFLHKEQRTDAATEWALSIAFAPFVTALSVLAFTMAGTSFRGAVNLTAILAVVPMAMPLLRSKSRMLAKCRLSFSKEAAMCYVCLALLILPLWLFIPGFHVYGWHHMMQLAVVYQLPDLPSFPEEFDLAGIPMNYGWLGHVQLTAVSNIVDVSPTLVFPILNLLRLWAWFTLIVAAARRISPGGQRFLPTAATIFILGTGAIGMLVGLIVGLSGRDDLVQFVVGESRIAPLVEKFLYIDLMVEGLTLFAALVYFTIAASEHVWRRAWFLLSITLLATGLMYPLLAPAAAMLMGVLILALFLQRIVMAPAYPRWQIGALICGVAVAALLIWGYLRSMSGTTAHTDLDLVRPWYWGHSVYNMVIAIGPWLVLAATRTRKGGPLTLPILVLSVGTVACGTLFLGVRMPDGVEYKTLFGAALCLAPVTVPVIASLLERRLPVQLAKASIVIVLYALAEVFTFVHHVPWNELRRAPVLTERSFRVSIDDADTYNWISALRNKTPSNTIIVAESSDIPISVLTRRPMLLATDRNRSTRPGYSAETEYYLIRVRGYREQIVKQRRAMVTNALQAANDNLDCTQLRDVIRLQRPVAIVSAQGRQAICSLPNVVIQTIWRDKRRTIWLAKSGSE
jgi:hypothetical protein